jgi:hypothetical protein
MLQKNMRCSLQRAERVRHPVEPAGIMQVTLHGCHSENLKKSLEHGATVLAMRTPRLMFDSDARTLTPA